MTTTQLEGPAIHVQGLEKSYKKLEVLRGVDFDVARGSIFALLGSNGAGKTTVVNILSTLLKADAGTATVNGFDVAAQPADVRESISLTGQFAAVDEILTGRENLVLVARLRHLKGAGQIADDLLARFQLTDAAQRRVSTYSGGMRRRLDIAMSLTGNPPVIFLDEPTTGLVQRGIGRSSWLPSCRPSGGYRAWSASPLVTIRDDIPAPIKVRWTPCGLIFGWRYGGERQPTLRIAGRRTMSRRDPAMPGSARRVTLRARETNSARSNICRPPVDCCAPCRAPRSRSRSWTGHARTA